MERNIQTEVPNLYNNTKMIEEPQNTTTDRPNQTTHVQHTTAQTDLPSQTGETSVINLDELDLTALASLSNLIGLSAAPGGDVATGDGQQDVNASVTLDVNALSSLMNLSALLDSSNGQIDLQDPTFIENLSHVLNPENLASLLNTQDATQDAGVQTTPPDSANRIRPQQPGTYRNNNNYDPNYKRRSFTPHHNGQQRWDDSQRYRPRNYQQQYDDTNHYDNNFNGNRGYGGYISSSKGGPYNNNRRPYDNYNNMNNNGNGKFFRRRPYNPNFGNNYDNNYRRYPEAEKLLEVPLNELAYGSNPSSNSNMVTSFLDRGDNVSNRDIMEEVKYDANSYYSDKLGLAEQYRNTNNETPISKNFQKSLAAASQENSNLKAHIQSCHDSLQKAKRSFFAIQPGFDIENLDACLDELLSTKKKPKKSSVLKKSINKITPKKSGPKSKLKKLSKLTEKPLLTSFESILDSFGGLNSFTKTENLDSYNERVHAHEVPQEMIRQVIRKEFETTPDHDQITSIHKILNQESCIYRFPSIQSKSLVYQTSAILSSGITVYIHFSSAYLISQCQKLSPSLTGGYIGNLISREKSTEHLELAKSGQLKILFTTPEKFIAENLCDILNISFICLDEAQCVPELSSNHRLNYNNFVKFIKRKSKVVPILAFVSPTTQQTCEDLAKSIQLPYEGIVPYEYFNSGVFDITISRDEDKSKALLNLLKSPKYKNNCHSMILYTECKKSTEDLANFLMSNGYKVSTFHNGKSDNQKFEVLANIVKNKEGIVVSTSNYEIGIDKDFVTCVVHYSMPKSLEIYIQEVSYLNDQAVCHMFLHDEDYFALSMNFKNDIIEKDQIKTFVDKVLDRNSAKLMSIKKKKDAEPSLFEDNPLFNTITKMITEFDSQIEAKDEKEEIYHMRVSEICQEVDLKKELIAQIFEQLQETDDWLEYCGINPIVCTVKIMHGKAQSLVSKYKLIQIMMENTKKESGIYHLAIIDMANELNCTANEVIRTLKNLQSEGSINYEVIEEAFCYKLIFDPYPAKVESKVEEIYLALQKKLILNLQKLDLMYAVAKVSSFQSVEHLAKQNKFDNDKRLKSPYSNSTLSSREATSPHTSSSMSERGNESSEKKKGKINLIGFFERYLNFRDDGFGGYDKIWDNLSSIREIIPLTKLNTQREKSNIIADSAPLVNEIFDEMNLLDVNGQQQEKMWDEDMLKAKLVRSVVKIVQGLPLYSSKKDWKSHKAWGKYYKCDFWDLCEVISEVVINFINTRDLKRIK